jgi:hypothetical protein
METKNGLWYCWSNPRRDRCVMEEISSVCKTMMVEMSGVYVCLPHARNIVN